MYSVINYGTLAYTVYSLGKKVISKYKAFKRAKPLRTLLGHRNVTIHIPSRSADRLNPLIAVEDFNAYEKIRDLLLSNGFKVRLKYINLEGTLELEHARANIVICGPKHSPVIKRTFDSIDNLTFKEVEGVWSLYLDDKCLESPVNDCYNQHAFLGKVKLDTVGFTEPVILICGIHAIGSEGVAYYLNNANALSLLASKVGLRLFRCVITSAYVKETKQICIASLHEGSMVIEESN